MSGPGRPPKPEGERYTHVVYAPVEVATHERLKHEAADLGVATARHAADQVLEKGRAMEGPDSIDPPGVVQLVATAEAFNALLRTLNTASAAGEEADLNASRASLLHCLADLEEQSWALHGGAP